MSLGECIGHAAAEDELVNLAEEILDDADLGRHLRTAHDGDERTFDVAEDIVHSLHFLLHEETEHTVLRGEIVSDDSCGSMFAVSCSESVHHPAVSIGSEFLGELFLGSLHGLLGSLVCRILLVDSDRLAFLLRIETEILEKKSLARLKSCSKLVCLLAVRSELYRNAEFLAHCINYLGQGKFRLDLSFRLAHVGHDDEGTALLKNEFEGRKCSANTSVVCDFAVLDRDVEIDSHNGLLAIKIVSVNVLLHILDIKVVSVQSQR